jgi:multidrug transporter EmrE-like cation transporter
VTAAATAPDTTAEGTRSSPFLGLVPYSVDDADYFFGRDDWCANVTDNLLAYRVSILYGASGIGKSSILQAGVLHGLRQTARKNVEQYGLPEFAVAVHRRWTDDPRLGLKQAVLDAVKATAPGLAADPPEGSLAQVLDGWSNRLGGPVLVVLDQFEEYFVYHRADRDAGFAAELTEALSRRDLVANFLISIREDALARLDVFEREVPGLLGNLIRIEHLDANEAREVIEKAVARWNEDHGESVGVDEDLIPVVLDGIRTGRVFVGETGQGIATEDEEDISIEAPYLQLVMTRLWDEERKAGSRRLRLETLTALGGVNKIVETHLDQTMSRLSKDERDIAARVFRYLVTPSGSKIAHSVVDLAKYAGVSDGDLEPVLARLAEPDVRVLRLVRPERDDVVERYEIFHDVLAAAILDWRGRYARFRAVRHALALAFAIAALLVLLIFPGVYIALAFDETYSRAGKIAFAVWGAFGLLWWVLAALLLFRRRLSRARRIFVIPLLCAVGVALGPIALPVLGIWWLVRRRRLRRVRRRELPVAKSAPT